MCGILGIISKTASTEDLKNSLDAIHHRGPDSTGVFADGNIQLGHKRLSIHDLSNSGNQPMFSSNETWVIVFNGEIYNYKNLIANFNLKVSSDSDTEVMIELIAKIGIFEAVKHFDGMFAFAAFNKEEEKLYLCRDRAGEKPLYFYKENEVLCFASELKAIYPLTKRTLNPKAIRDFFYYNYIPEKNCILDNCQKVLPGEIITININRLTLAHERYWAPKDLTKSIREFKSLKDAADQLESILKEVIQEQLDSDVPIGAFLSGGIDSTLVCSIAQSLSKEPIKTFCIAFEDPEYNESEYAKKIASHLGTNHIELKAKPSDCIELVDKIAEIYDEPMSDSSQLPTLLLSRLTKKHVTVCLGGDGADELFGGYNRHHIGASIFNKLLKFPLLLRRLIKKTILLLKPNTWNKIKVGLGNKVYKLASIIDAKDFNEYYQTLISHWRESSPLTDKTIKHTEISLNSNSDTIQNMMLLDFETYLPGDILVKTDRASMSTSLELRSPFLDRRVIEFALSLPLHFKVNSNEGKLILREILYRYVPKELIDRPKKGFGVPLDNWLRNDLKSWASSLVNNTQNLSHILDHQLITRKFDEHLSGNHNHQFHIWDVIIFIKWLKTYKLKYPSQ